MRWTPLHLAVLGATVLGVVSPSGDSRSNAQTPVDTSRAQRESGLTVSCELFCSDTKLRTSNARIRWSLSAPALAASGLESLSTAKQRLEATVFHSGFEKGLYATLPVAVATPERPIAAIAQPGQALRRAYQIQIIEIEQPSLARSGEMGVVVEGLESGVNYTWRIVLESATGRLVSAPVTCRARICPADLIPPNDVPKKRP